MKILLIEDEKITRITLTNTLKKEGYEVSSSATGTAGMELLKQKKFDVIITDLRLPRMNGLDILKKVKEKTPQTEVIIITAFATVETAVEALKSGAYDYLTKPFSPDKLLSMLSHIEKIQTVLQENKELKTRLELVENRPVIGQSEVIRKLMDTVKAVAPNNYTVLIEGESGTGKELIARTLHQFSKRSDKPFIAVNCAAIPESLLESELFGYEKGAFTGAHKRHLGYFERADKGTLFIDDIDDFPMHLQVKLLRILQERELIRVGGNETIKVDVRIIGATKVNLKEKIKENQFREDLYYRLNIIPLKIPPLRERKEDIPLLIEHFLKKQGELSPLQELPPEIISRLIAYDWPGNVRELENIVERLVAFSALSGISADLPDLPPINKPELPQINNTENEEFPPYEEFVKNNDITIITRAMQKADNNYSRAAKLLGLPRSTLKSKIAKLGLKF